MNEKPDSNSAPSNIDLHALDVVLDQFFKATKDAAVPRAQLYKDFHRRLVACTDSMAAAVFSKRKNSQFAMVSQSGWRALDAAALKGVKSAIKQHYQASNSVGTTGDVSAFVQRTKPINGVEYLFVLVRQRESDSLSNHVFEDLTQEIASQIENYEVKRSASQKPQAIQDITHLVQLAQNVGKSRNLTQLSMHLANDLSKSTDADRVCIFNPSGKLMAVSGVSQASLKTSLVKTLSRIARIAKSNSTSVESVKDQVVFGDNRNQKKVSHFLAQLDAEIVYVSPIEVDGRCCGIASFEYFESKEDQNEWIDQRNLISQSLHFIAPVVSRCVQVQSIPGIRFLDFVFNRVFTKPARLLLWLMSLGMLAFAALYFLFLVERPFEIHAEGTLQPIVTRNIFAPRIGEIQSLFVEEGSIVRAGDALALIESKELRERLIVVEGELAEANQELQNLMVADIQSSSNSDDQSTDRQTQTASEIKRLQAKTATLLKQQELLEQESVELSMVSPIDGQVTTQDVDRRLDSRPVDRGDLLMAISAMDGEWEIELKIPDNRVEFIQNSKDAKVRFRIASDSESLFDGQLREFDFRVQQPANDSETYSRALIDIDEAELNQNLRLGSRVIAKIDCGKRTNFFLLTYELENKLREWFFF